MKGMQVLRQRRIVLDLILQFFIIIGACIQLFPLLWLLTFSLKSNIELFGDNVLGFPRQFLWKNYTRVFENGNLALYFRNSVVITAATIIISGFLSSTIAFATTRMKWKMAKPVFLLFLLGLMIPIHASLLPLFLTLKPILNTHLALVVPYVGFAMPLSILILSGFMGSISRELEEAAFIDGASIYRVFYSIILPLMKPALATVSILTYLSSWNELMFAITFVNKESYKTLTFGIMSMVGRYSTNWGPIGAGLVVATIPTLILYILMSEQIQGSLAAGAIKG
ncbi:carbohydrate ABC transporter permease [Treponema sp.]